MLIDSEDGRLLVVSASEPRYALHTVELNDGRKLAVKEDIFQTQEHRWLAELAGEHSIQPGPRFYVTSVTLPSGDNVDPSEAVLPKSFRSNNGTIIDRYVSYAPNDK